MNIREYMQENVLILDGGMGTMLQARGLRPGEHPEMWNITHPEDVRQIHQAYYDAGSNVVSTNTFGANPLNFGAEELEKIISCAIANVRAAAEKSKGPQAKFVALDIGPTGRLLKPYGDLDFEDAVAAFAQVVRIGARCGADLVIIETMNDSYETKAALLAAKENCDLPVFVSNAYGADGKLMTGASPAAMAALLEGMGADAIGANCSLGPAQLRGVIEELKRCTRLPVLLKPNAGMPKVVAGKTVYDITAEEFADEVALQVQNGVAIAGGCCGTTPEHIAALSKRCAGMRPAMRSVTPKTRIASYTHALKFGADPILVGERINPTGKKRLKRALMENDMDYILQEGVSQQEKAVHVLDVNVGLPGIDETDMLRRAVCELQAVINLPLQIDTSDPAAMEAALRRINGKALINSVNGKQESMQAIFPLVKKYGGVMVALTLDENGIPATADGRIAIARRILEAAEAYGIAREDIIFDPLCMAVSADANAARVTLESVARIRAELGCHTILGVSNVSFGLPERAIVNHIFFAQALQAGLSAAIMNPFSDEMIQTYHAHRALHALDENCAGYIEYASTRVPAVPAAKSAAVRPAAGESGSVLHRAIAKGLAEQAAGAVRDLLQTEEPMKIVSDHIIPALDDVGRGFEKQTVYLPQLLTAAEAAKAAFGVIKANMKTDTAPAKCDFVLATVEGDIHDIGKNIVKLLLENYGYRVHDLGRDVPPQAILDVVRKHNAPLVGLSALMTTTVPAMEETIRLLHEQAPGCKVIVGGAVLNEDYASRIGADFYAKDAMEAVRCAERA